MVNVSTKINTLSLAKPRGNITPFCLEKNIDVIQKMIHFSEWYIEEVSSCSEVPTVPCNEILIWNWPLTFQRSTPRGRVHFVDVCVQGHLPPSRLLQCRFQVQHMVGVKQPLNIFFKCCNRRLLWFLTSSQWVWKNSFRLQMRDFNTRRGNEEKKKMSFFVCLLHRKTQ